MLDSRIRSATADDSRLTRAFSGRPARAKNNRYIEAMAENRTRLPDFPTMYGFSEPLEQACRERDKSGFEFFLWGQGAALNRDLPAGELLEQLVVTTSTP